MYKLIISFINIKDCDNIIMVKDNVVRVGGKIIRKPTRPSQEESERFKKIVNKEKQRIRKAKLKEERQKVAKDLDEQFKKAKFSNINQAKKQLEKIKQSNPKVYNFM